jgi:hypothetical protein
MSLPVSNLPAFQFRRYQNTSGLWVSGCLLCLKIIGTARLPEELTALERVHICPEKETIPPSRPTERP